MPDDRRLAFQEHGSGEALVLIHGLAGSGSSWKRNIEGLNAHFRVITLDLPGFGNSRSDGRHRLDTAVFEIVNWMEQVGLEQAHFAGHSLGGLIASKLAAEFPSRVNRLVLVSAALLSLDPGFVRRLSGLVKPAKLMPLDFAAQLAKDAVRAGPINLAMATHQLLRNDWQHELELIRSSTLIVWGEDDVIVAPVVGVRMNAAIPGSRLIVIPNASHVPMWDRPVAFNQAAISFLSEA